MKKITFFLMFIACFVAQAQDVANGKKLYTKCISCHGADGMGKASQKAPMIAAQHDWYVTEQLVEIRDKKRVSGNTSRMYPFVKGLSDQEIEDLAAYISQMPPKK